MEEIEAENEFIAELSFECDPIKSYERLFDFSIESLCAPVEYRKTPLLNLPPNMTSLNINLLENLEEWKKNFGKITDKTTYRNRKWERFLEILNKKQFMKKESPHIVSFGSIITSVLCAIYDDSEKCIYAVMFEGVIYLYDQKCLSSEETFTEPHNSLLATKRFHKRITNLDESSINNLVNYFTVGKFQFNEHKLLTLNEFHAMDENEELVFSVRISDSKIEKIKKKIREKIFYQWANCRVNGIKKLIIGYHVQEILKEIKEFDVAGLPEQYKDYWSESKCYLFLDNVLKFIRECVKVELSLYEFRLNPSTKLITCNRIASNEDNVTFLPNWFTNR